MIRYLNWITRDMLRASPEARFVFGDNAERWGLGGQAKEMRGEPNAIGVATLYAPGRYFPPHDPYALDIVMADLAKVTQALREGRTVFVPADGIGTGLARLQDNNPDLADLIAAYFRACPQSEPPRCDHDWQPSPHHPNAEFCPKCEVRRGWSVPVSELGQ